MADGVRWFKQMPERWLWGVLCVQQLGYVLLSIVCEAVAGFVVLAAMIQAHDPCPGTKAVAAVAGVCWRAVGTCTVWGSAPAAAVLLGDRHPCDREGWAEGVSAPCAVRF